MSEEPDQKARKKKKEARKHIITARLNDADFAKFEAKVLASNLTRSEFFRDSIINNKTKVYAKQAESKDYKNLLFVINKASNNLNQIAKRLNADFKSGIVAEKTYEDSLYELSIINSYLKGVL